MRRARLDGIEIGRSFRQGEGGAVDLGQDFSGEWRAAADSHHLQRRIVASAKWTIGSEFVI